MQAFTNKHLLTSIRVQNAKKLPKLFQGQARFITIKNSYEDHRRLTLDESTREDFWE
jgi:hypothetical protein